MKQSMKQSMKPSGKQSGKPRLKVVFFGTPQFAANLLSTLVAHQIDIVAVVTKPDRPQGRSGKLIPSEVKQTALQLLPHSLILQPATTSTEDFYQHLAALHADLFVVVAYGEIIKQLILDLPKFGCINVHASILPKYRGAAPIQRSIMAGEHESGVTIMQMVRKMDAGDIIQIAKVPIAPATTYGELESALCTAAEAPLLEALDKYAAGTPPSHYPQDETKITFAPKIELEECQIDWQKSAESIHNLIRGVNPHPGAWCYVNIKGEQKRLKIWQSSLLESAFSQTSIAGSLLPNESGLLLVACGEGALALQQVQLEGKRKMDAAEFLRGTEKIQFTVASSAA